MVGFRGQIPCGVDMAVTGKSSHKETLAVHTETALWHIAMPVVGAVYRITSGLCCIPITFR